MVGRAGQGRLRFKFKSGSLKQYPEDFQDTIKATWTAALEEGTQSFLAKFIKKVARKTGKLRRWIRNMVSKQADITSDRMQVTLWFKQTMTHSYFQYHILGIGKTHKSFRRGVPYKAPTVKGTKPISVTDFMYDWSAEIEKTMIEKFDQEGLSYKTFVSAKFRRVK